MTTENLAHNLHITPECLEQCSLLPAQRPPGERAATLGRLAELGVASHCNGPRHGQIKPVCHQPESMKREMLAHLHATGQIGGAAAPMPTTFTPHEIEPARTMTETVVSLRSPHAQASGRFA